MKEVVCVFVNVCLRVCMWSFVASSDPRSKETVRKGQIYSWPPRDYCFMDDGVPKKYVF
jgi:hypothetical protein